MEDVRDKVLHFHERLDSHESPRFIPPMLFHEEIRFDGTAIPASIRHWIAVASVALFITENCPAGKAKTWEARPGCKTSKPGRFLRV